MFECLSLHGLRTSPLWGGRKLHQQFSSGGMADKIADPHPYPSPQGGGGDYCRSLRMSRFIEFQGGDVEAYLRTQENKDLLRFITCGSVDDGKSTLIGRLLYEAKMLFEDQLTALEGRFEKDGHARRQS